MGNKTIKIKESLNIKLLILSRIQHKTKEQLINELLEKGIEPYLPEAKQFIKR